MRQVLLCVSLLLLGLTWTVAQTSGGSDSSGAAGSAQSGASGQMGQSGGSGDHMTVQGCLSGSNGNYTLTDKNGNSYQLTGDNAKLSEHVGHEVKVMGSSSAAGSSAASGSTAGSGSQQSLQVTSVKHVSKTCQSAGGTTTH